MPMVLSELAYSIQPDTVAESSIFSVFSPHDRIRSPVRGSIHADYSVRILFLSIAISGFLYTSFTNCSPQTGQNPVSLEHKEAASRKAPRRDNSSLSNRHSSISPLFSLFLSRKAAGSHAGGFSSVCTGASGQIRTVRPAEKMRPAAPSGAFLIIWFPA